MHKIIHPDIIKLSTLFQKLACMFPFYTNVPKLKRLYLSAEKHIFIFRSSHATLQTLQNHLQGFLDCVWYRSIICPSTLFPWLHLVLLRRLVIFQKRRSDFICILLRFQIFRLYGGGRIKPDQG